MGKHQKGTIFFIMTVFEKTIDTSQVQMELSLFGAFLLVLLGFLVFLFCLSLILVGREKYKNNTAHYMFHSFVVAIIGSVITVSIATHFSSIKATEHPVYGESKNYTARNHSKKSITDTYREDIDKAVEDKLKDYKILDTSTNGINPEKSILNGGYEVEDVAAIHDGKTYTLTPQWDYDRDDSKITLSVDIEEDNS